MSSKYLVSVKSTGLSYNIIKLIILTDLAKRYNRQLVFITESEHIPTLKKFNNACLYLACVPGHTEKYNSYSYKRQPPSIYELKYKKFLKSTYIDDITLGNISLSDIKYTRGCVFDISNSPHNVLLAEYCTNINGTVKALHDITCPDFIRGVSHSKYDNNILSINVKIDDPSNSRIYEFWDEIIPALKKKYNKTILLISGNNDIKKYLGNKHNCLYEIKETEKVFLAKRKEGTIKGTPINIYDDLIICKSTHFLPLTKIEDDYYDIISKYRDIGFLYGNAVEHFDILAHYLSTAIQVP